jgi:hypothetical protein
MVLSAGCSPLRAEGFFCNLHVLYGGLGIGKLYFLIKKKLNFFSAVNFFQFLVIKTLNPDWIRIGIQSKMTDPNPYQMKTDPKPCIFHSKKQCVQTRNRIFPLVQFDIDTQKGCFSLMVG